jgi:hypothetical protein
MEHLMYCTNGKILDQSHSSLFINRSQLFTIAATTAKCINMKNEDTDNIGRSGSHW